MNHYYPFYVIHRGKKERVLTQNYRLVTNERKSQWFYYVVQLEGHVSANQYKVLLNFPYPVRSGLFRIGSQEWFNEYESDVNHNAVLFEDTRSHLN